MAIAGNVKALVETASGNLLAGTDNLASVYKSTDNGQTWSLLTSLATNPDDGSVNAFVRVNNGKIFAAVSGSAAVQGVWVNAAGDGASWTRVKSHPRGDGYGYLDITAIQGSRLVAVGYGSNSASDGPIILSNNDGASWLNCYVPQYNYDFKAVSAPPDLVLPSNYSGDSVTFVPAFYGSNSYYTLAGRAGYSSFNGQAVTTVSGAMGNGGLDMAGFLIRNAVGNFNVIGVWAVRSHLNTADTEIWQFPSSPTGPFNFKKIATITSEQFNVLYVEPQAWQDITTLRTLWAGADGKIYVSYNNGLTWAVATSAPSGNIYAFVRTSSGYLVAGGESGEIFILGGSGSEGGGGGDTTPPDDGEDDDDPPTDPTEPEAPSLQTARYLGRNATCDEEVFVANKSSFSNITHLMYYNGSDCINMQFGAEPPYSLLGATPAVGRAIYFGSRTSDADVPGGPFSSLVFNITYAASDITITWEYWDGSAWSSLSVMDNTAAFSLLGVRSVHWTPPSDWDTSTVNTVTGYWIRARVSAVGSSPVGPVHSARYVYTPNLPYVEIAASAIGGTLPAMGQVMWRNQADNPGGTPSLEAHRMLIALRSVSRGENFQAYINLSDVQAPFGVTVSDQNADGGFEDAINAPTARRYSLSYSGSGDLGSWQDIVKVALSTTVARDFYGDFRVFLRGYVSAGEDTDWKVRLALGVGSGGVRSYTRAVAAMPVEADLRLWDMGSIHIPSATLSTNQLSDELSVTVQGYAAATDVPLKLYDLIFMPIDEWIGDFRHTNLSDSALDSGVNGTDYLDVDSVSNPKASLTAFNRLDSNLLKALYQTIANGGVMLQQGQQQRIWFLVGQYDFSTTSWASFPTMAGTVRVNMVQRYDALRGAE